MTRPVLTLAKAPAQPRGPSLSLVKKALRLYRGRGIDKAVYRKNAMKWLVATQSLGDGSLLRGASPKWGRPGLPGVGQVFAPRRARS
jgi:hypothetical protein